MVEFSGQIRPPGQGLHSVMAIAPTLSINFNGGQVWGVVTPKEN